MSYSLLKIQYRMNERIMKIFSKFIYHSELSAGDANKNISLKA